MCVCASYLRRVFSDLHFAGSLPLLVLCCRLCPAVFPILGCPCMTQAPLPRSKLCLMKVGLQQFNFRGGGGVRIKARCFIKPYFSSRQLSECSSVCGGKLGGVEEVPNSHHDLVVVLKINFLLTFILFVCISKIVTVHTHVPTVYNIFKPIMSNIKTSR